MPFTIFVGWGCPNCKTNKSRLTNEIVEKRLYFKNIVKFEDFINVDTKMKFKCLKCDNIWSALPSNIFKGSGCPKCSRGKNEKNVEKIIKKYCNYSYIDCHKKIIFNERRYHPDFYLVTNNQPIIIEYNGEQHYRPIRFGGISQERAIKNFEIQQKRDQELRDYCSQNNIILLEIPYYWKEDKIIEELQKIN